MITLKVTRDCEVVDSPSNKTHIKDTVEIYIEGNYFRSFSLDNDNEEIGNFIRKAIEREMIQ